MLMVALRSRSRSKLLNLHREKHLTGVKLVLDIVFLLAELKLKLSRLTVKAAHATPPFSISIVIDSAMITANVITATVWNVLQLWFTTAAITANKATMPLMSVNDGDVRNSSAFSASAFADCIAVLSLFNEMVFISSYVWHYRAIKNGCPYPVAKRKKIPPESKFLG